MWKKAKVGLKIQKQWSKPGHREFPFGADMGNHLIKGAGDLNLLSHMRGGRRVTEKHEISVWDKSVYAGVWLDYSFILESRLEDEIEVT